MWPTSVAMPVAVTTNSPLPRVTLVFMYTMSVRSPSGVSGDVDGLDALRHRQALAGQRGLGHLEGGGVEDAAVGRHDVARLERHHVAGHELLGGQLGDGTVPAHLRLDEHHLLQGGDGGRRLALLAAGRSPRSPA